MAAEGGADADVASGAAFVLEAQGLSRSFAGVPALQRADLRLRAGEVHVLMGQNGAGKPTLIKLLAGLHAPDAGTLRLQGREIRPRGPGDAQRLGISTVYQEVNLAPNLSVAENIVAGRWPRHGAAGLWRIDWGQARRQAREALARLHLDLDVDQLLGELPVAVQQMVAIARALSVDARVLILDEPTSSLDADEVARLFAVLRELRGQGLAILFVTHFLDQVYEIGDRITVLRNGALVGEYTPQELPAPALIDAMVGRPLRSGSAPAEAGGAAGRPPAAAAQGVPALRTQGLGRRGVLQPVSMTLHPGEVLGLAGLLGSGRSELARLLFGLDRADAGTLEVSGRPLRGGDPLQAIRRGLALCPEERKVDGIVGELSVRENIVLALQARQGLWPAVPLARQQQIARDFVQALGIRTADIETPVARLSGGNQQKVVLARWLLTRPAVLMLDEPTRGIDVAAKQEVMDEVLKLAREGMAVLFISSEIDEVLRVSDRLMVMRDRRCAGELPGGCGSQAVFDLIAGAH